MNYQNFTPLDINNFQKSKKSRSFFPVLFTFVILAVSSLISGFVVFALPRIQLLGESRKTLSLIPGLEKEITNTNISVKKMSDFIFNQKTRSANTVANTGTIIRLNLYNFIFNTKSNNKKGEVAGIQTQTGIIGLEIKDFSDNIDDLYKTLKDASASGVIKRKVLGENTVLEDERKLKLKKLKDIARSELDAINNTRIKLDDFSIHLKKTNNNRSGDFSKITKDLEDNNQKVNKYLDQNQEIASYYYQIADFQTSLDSFLSSYYNTLYEIYLSTTTDLYLTHIKELLTQINKLNKDLKNIKGVDELRSYNLKTIAVLTNSINDADKFLTNKGELTFNQIILKLKQQLETLSSQAVDLESNFWRNKMIKNPEDFLNNYKYQTVALQDLIQKKNLLFF